MSDDNMDEEANEVIKAAREYAEKHAHEDDDNAVARAFCEGAKYMANMAKEIVSETFGKVPA